MTFRHRAGVRPYASPCGFAESCVFGKQSPGPGLCGSPFWGERPFSRSYGAVLPSSLAAVAPSASACSAGPPASVCGTGARRFDGARAFLGPLRAPVRTRCFPGLSAGRGRPEPRRPLGGRRARASGARCRNVYLPPFGCAWRPPLRTRLTLGGRAFPRKPRAFGGGGSHPTLATRAGILTPARSTGPRRARFAARGKLPYRWRPSLPSRRFGASLSPVNCRRPGARPVSCYALLGRVAASEPTSWLSARPDILCHSARTWGPWRAVWAVPLSGARLSPRVLTPALHAACVRSSVPFGRLRGPLGDPVALPPAGSARGPP